MFVSHLKVLLAAIAHIQAGEVLTSGDAVRGGGVSASS